MADHPSALKRMRQNAQRRVRHRSYRSTVKTAIKRYLSAVEERKPDAADHYRQAVSLLQKGVSKGIYHVNTASRTISRLAKKLRAA